MEPRSIADRIKEDYPEDVVKIEEFRDEATVYVKKDHILSLTRYLKESKVLKMDFLSDLTALDWLGIKDVRYEVVYHLYSIEKAHMIRIKALVPEDSLYIDSVANLWNGANWHERECYDMFGIEFVGHPDLRRILMPEDWEGYPLRKDYPTEGPDTEWRGFTEVLKKYEEYSKYEWNR